MFIEPQLTGERRGWIEVITGSMFSGKTEELIRRLKRARITKQKVEIFKPDIDTRYDVNQIVSHDENFIQSTTVSHSGNILFMSDMADVIGIDEAQFFDEGIIDVCRQLALKGVRVVIAGLDMDYTGKPFGPMPHLLAIADYITKVHAICVRCGHIANYSYRLVKNDAQIMLGEKKEYEPLCRFCYLKSG
ncbi:MAG: thymidine kinase [Chitinophagales bacterium]